MVLIGTGHRLLGIAGKLLYFPIHIAQGIKMKVIGILGGMSPESTKDYYEHIVRQYHERFGDYRYPEMVIYSVNFQKYVDWMNAGEWAACADDMVRTFELLHKAGADFGIIAANTPHKVFDDVENRSPIPLISIVEATADAILAEGINKIGLLGTIFTMTESFYYEDLNKRGIEAIVPSEADITFVNDVIYNELTKGEVKADSKNRYIDIAQKMINDGAMGIILGCTEIPMILKDDDIDVILFDTAKIHAEAALNYAIE